jgi:hypothetical protein
MTTSSSYDWEMTRDQIITDALRKVGAIDEESTPTAAQLTIGARTLNGVAKALAGQAGMPLWSIKEVAITLTATNSYTCGIGSTVNIAKPLKILQAWRRTSSIDTPVTVISMDEYNRLPAKSNTGPPIQVAYQPDISTGVLRVYQTPDTYSIANTTLYIRYHRPFQDFDTSTDTPDFPTEWDLPLTFHLALALSPDYGVPKQDKQDLKQLADMYTEMAQSTEYENASFMIQPDTSYQRR